MQYIHILRVLFIHPWIDRYRCSTHHFVVYTCILNHIYQTYCKILLLIKIHDCDNSNNYINSYSIELSVFEFISVEYGKRITTLQIYQTRCDRTSRETDSFEQQIVLVKQEWQELGKRHFDARVQQFKLVIVINVRIVNIQYR